MGRDQDKGEKMVKLFLCKKIVKNHLLDAGKHTKT